MRFYSRSALLILAAALGILFYQLFLGNVLFWGLPALQFVPWRGYAFDQLRAGYLPLWNPFNGAGAPLFANYQSSLLYPFTWIGYLLPLAQTMSLVAVLHLFIGGWGMWRFSGRLGISSLGRGVSALAFGLSAYLVARLGTYPVIQAAAWLPWLLWAAHRLLESGRPRSAGMLAIFAALLLLAGHAQTAWYSLLLGGFFALWWTLTHRPFRWLRLIAVAGCLALGAGIAGLQLVATAELLTQSQRAGGVDFDFAMNFSYAPASALNLFAPNVFGTPADATYILPRAYFEDAVYIGVIPLIAALAAAISRIARWRDPDRPTAYATTFFWLIVVVIGFVFALGVNTSIFPFLYHNVPTFNLFQAPVRWHLWTVVGLSMLAGIGVTVWERTHRWRRWTIRMVIACTAAAALGFFAQVLRGADNVTIALLANAVFTAGLLAGVTGVLMLMLPQEGTPGYGFWSMLLLVIVAADLVLASWGLNPTVPPTFYDTISSDTGQARRYWTAAAEENVKFGRYFHFSDYPMAVDQWHELRQSDLPNLNLIDGLPLLNNFDPLLVGHFADYHDLIEAYPDSAAALLQAAGVGAVYTPDLQLLDQPAARAWLLTSICWHVDQASLEAALVDPAWQPLGQAHMLGVGGCDAPHSVVDNVTVTIDMGNSVTLTVDAPQDSWLILADTDYPGWTATVDGVETPIYRANLNFRALQVDSGLHEVHFDYQPQWLLPGALVSAISLLLALLLYRLGA